MRATREVVDGKNSDRCLPAIKDGQSPHTSVLHQAGRVLTVLILETHAKASSHDFSRWRFCRILPGRTSEYLLWPIKSEHCADVSATPALNVVFKLINNEFLFRNYIVEQIADGNNADHFCVFDYG